MTKKFFFLLILRFRKLSKRRKKIRNSFIFSYVTVCERKIFWSFFFFFLKESKKNLHFIKMYSPLLNNLFVFAVAVKYFNFCECADTFFNVQKYVNLKLGFFIFFCTFLYIATHQYVSLKKCVLKILS